jgi:hypothetical protein
LITKDRGDKVLWNKVFQGHFGKVKVINKCKNEKGLILKDGNLYLFWVTVNISSNALIYCRQILPRVILKGQVTQATLFMKKYYFNNILSSSKLFWKRQGQSEQVKI